MAKNFIYREPVLSAFMGIIIAALGWNLIQTYSLGREVSEVNMISKNNENRMDRIGETIPQIKSALAAIEIEKLLNNALIAFEPQKDSNEVWSMNIALASVSSSELTSYNIKLDSLEDNYVMMAASGTIMNSKKGSVLSFYDFEKFSNKYVDIPNNIDSKNSWIISGSTEEISKLLKSKSETINRTELKLTEKNFQSLIDSLKVQ
ncbi:hypothetical protein [Aquimarina rubra]|uniref:DUF4230 domain-containing protein n=1 Tax=Aquimarina rubra TaxID=1920033 RepID=A0ABW5LH21_9FLAO